MPVIAGHCPSLHGSQCPVEKRALLRNISLITKSTNNRFETDALWRAPQPDIRTRMNKRLRKKKHQGEFSEWGCQLVITRNRKDEFDEFLYSFVEEAIEANNCFCGGGGKDDELDVIVELGRMADNPDGKLDKVTGWLDQRMDVVSYKTGEMFDLWHGDFDDISEKF